MLDIPLATHFLKGNSAHASFVFFGAGWTICPSIGFPGNFLRDLIDRTGFPWCWLTEICPPGENSIHYPNAHLVNEGQLPVLDAPEESDFFFIAEEDPETVLATIKTFAAERVPKKFGFDPMRDVHVLTPMHKVVCCSENF